MSERAETGVESVTGPPRRRKATREVTRRAGRLRSRRQDRSGDDASLRPLARALLALAEQLREEGAAWGP
jgi:hypothetical protein